MSILLLLFTIVFFTVVYILEGYYDYNGIRLKNEFSLIFAQLSIDQRMIFRSNYDNYYNIWDKSEHYYDMIVFSLIHLAIAFFSYLVLRNFLLVTLLTLLGGLIRWFVHDGCINIFRGLPFDAEFTNDGEYDFFDRFTIAFKREFNFSFVYVKIISIVLSIGAYLWAIL